MQQKANTPTARRMAPPTEAPIAILAPVERDFHFCEADCDALPELAPSSLRAVVVLVDVSHGLSIRDDYALTLRPEWIGSCQSCLHRHIGYHGWHLTHVLI